MKIAVIQHRLRENAEDDARALVLAVGSAAASGAELVVVPEVLSLHDRANSAGRLLAEKLAEVAAFCLVPDLGPDSSGAAFISELPETAGLSRALHRAAVLVGDAAIDPVEHARAAAARPVFAVLSPRSESDLQVEAVLELAIGLSYSLAGLIIVVECSGAEPGRAGHGGSAIVLLGDVLAEANFDDDVLLAEIPEPVPQPEPAEALPELPPILAQRLASHRGLKIEQPYPADLS